MISHRDEGSAAGGWVEGLVIIFLVGVELSFGSIIYAFPFVLRAYHFLLLVLGCFVHYIFSGVLFDVVRGLANRLEMVACLSLADQYVVGVSRYDSLLSEHILDLPQVVPYSLVFYLYLCAPGQSFAVFHLLLHWFAGNPAWLHRHQSWFFPYLVNHLVIKTLSASLFFFQNVLNSFGIQEGPEKISFFLLVERSFLFVHILLLQQL